VSGVGGGVKIDKKQKIEKTGGYYFVGIASEILCVGSCAASLCVLLPSALLILSVSSNMTQTNEKQASVLLSQYVLVMLCLLKLNICE